MYYSFILIILNIFNKSNKIIIKSEKKSIYQIKKLLFIINDKEQLDFL